MRTLDVDVAPSTSISTSQLAQFSSPVQFLPFFPLYRLALYLNRLESCPSPVPGGIPRAGPPAPSPSLQIPIRTPLSSHKFTLMAAYVDWALP